MQAVKQELAVFWSSLRRGFDLLVEHKADAVRTLIDALHERATIAGQAGDIRTLVRDQLEMLENSREQLRTHRRGLVAIAQRWRRDRRAGAV